MAGPGPPRARCAATSLRAEDGRRGLLEGAAACRRTVAAMTDNRPPWHEHMPSVDFARSAWVDTIAPHPVRRARSDRRPGERRSLEFSRAAVTSPAGVPGRARTRVAAGTASSRQPPARLCEGLVPSRRSSRSWRPIYRCATSTTGARSRKRWRRSGSTCGRCLLIRSGPTCRAVAQVALGYSCSCFRCEAPRYP